MSRVTGDRGRVEFEPLAGSTVGSGSGEGPLERGSR